MTGVLEYALGMMGVEGFRSENHVGVATLITWNENALE